MDGTALVGWILLTVAFGGLYGAVKNESWLSVLTKSVNPKSNAQTIDAPSNSGWGSGGSGDWGSGGTVTAHGSAATVLDYAKAQLGKPYRWGGAGPNDFDCSGLAMRAFDTVGINLPHNTVMQLAATVTSKITTSTAPPAGALVFYGTPPHHVGISTGDGKMISAPHTGSVVRVDDIAGFGSDLSACTDPLGGW